MKRVQLTLIGVFDRRGLLAKLVACCLSSLIACAGAPPKDPILPSIDPGRSFAQVAEQTHTARRLPAFEFVAGAHWMALFYVDAKGVLSDSVNASELPTVMLFEDDGYLGALSAKLALAFEACLDQPAGPELLAERLRMLVAGKLDPFVATSLAADGPSACPSGLRPPPPERKLPALVQGVGGHGGALLQSVSFGPFVPRLTGRALDLAALVAKRLANPDPGPAGARSKEQREQQQTFEVTRLHWYVIDSLAN